MLNQFIALVLFLSLPAFAQDTVVLVCDSDAYTFRPRLEITFSKDNGLTHARYFDMFTDVEMECVNPGTIGTYICTGFFYATEHYNVVDLANLRVAHWKGLDVHQRRSFKNPDVLLDCRK